MGIHNRIQVEAWLVTCTCTWTRLHFTCACTGRNFPPSVREQRYLTARHHIFERSCCIITNPAPANVQKNIGICDHINYYYLALNNISRRSRMVRGRERFGSCWNIIIKVLVRWTQGLHNVCSMVVHCPEETQHIFGDQMPPIEFVCGSICAYAQSIFAFFELIRLFG